MNFIQINPTDITFEPDLFSKISKQWFLVGTGDQHKQNCMTASWGGLGVIWGKNAATIYVRQSRYTYELIEDNSHFVLTFLTPTEKNAKALAVCGKVSGKDGNKMAQAGLTLTFIDGFPTCKQAELVLICKKMYADDIEENKFVDKSCLESYYKDNDFHRMYIGEIVKVYKADL